jgi:hypothetical protein
VLFVDIGMLLQISADKAGSSPLPDAVYGAGRQAEAVLGYIDRST